MGDNVVDSSTVINVPSGRGCPQLGGCEVRGQRVYESSLYYFLLNFAVNPKLPLKISLLIKKIIDY